MTTNQNAKQLVEAWAEKKTINEDAGLAAGIALGALGAGFGMRKVSGMQGPATDSQWKPRAGPITKDENNLVKQYPTSYGLGDTIKHLLIGKSGNDKEQEVQDARYEHEAAVHAGNPEAIETNGGYDPLGGVRGGVAVSDEHKPVVDFVHAVLTHARETGNDYAEPEEGNEADHYNVEHAAAEHLVNSGVLPSWGDKEGNDGHYLDKVRLSDDGSKVRAVYRENKMRGRGYGFNLN